MKEAIGGVSLFQIVIVFILIFTGVMCLTINHSKAFGVKDEIITTIENSALASNSSVSTINHDDIVNLLDEVGYRTTGSCPDEEGWEGYNRSGNVVSNNASYCLRKVDVTESFRKDLKDKCKNNKCKTSSGDYPEMVYYEVILFYQLDVPVLHNLMNFKIYGSTKVLFS